MRTKILTVAIVAIFSLVGFTSAEENIFWKTGVNGKLQKIRSEVITEYPAPPEGIIPEIAGKIIEGEKYRKPIEKMQMPVIVKVFPLPMSAYKQNEFSFENGSWQIKEMLTVPDQDNRFIVFGFAIPMLWILILNLLATSQEKITACYYGVILIAMVTGLIIGPVAGIIGGIGGVAVAFVVGDSNERFKTAYWRMALGALGGGLIGSNVGELSVTGISTSTVVVAMQYATMIIGAIIASYFIRFVARVLLCKKEITA